MVFATVIVTFVTCIGSWKEILAAAVQQFLITIIIIAAAIHCQIRRPTSWLARITLWCMQYNYLCNAYHSCPRHKFYTLFINYLPAVENKAIKHALYGHKTRDCSFTRCFIAPILRYYNTYSYNRANVLIAADEIVSFITVNVLFHVS